MAAPSSRERVGDCSKDVVGNVKRTAKLLLKEAEEGSKPPKLDDLIR